MTSRPFYRLLLTGGIAVTLLGLYAGAQTSNEFRWDSLAAIIIIGVGVLMAIIGLFNVLGSGRPAREEESRRESVLPANMIPLVYGGFVGLIALVAGLVVGHYAGRNEGF